MEGVQQERGGCRVTVDRCGPYPNAVTLENEWMAATVLPDKGADIHVLRYKPRGMDVLWKAPWPVKMPGTMPAASDSETFWLERYPGGWQELFPNVGDACRYRGVELGFHGEASVLPWSYDVIRSTGREAVVRFSVALYHSPFTLTRTMSLKQGEPVLVLSEEAVNEAPVEMDLMWGHHPAYGAPFLSEACVIDVAAETVVADSTYDPPGNYLAPGGVWRWPEGRDKQGRAIDLSRVRGPHDRVSCFAYLKNLREGWVAITNTKAGFGVGMVWPKEVLPYVHLWQEIGGSAVYPFYGRAYTIGIEPMSSVPGRGLAATMRETGTQLRLRARSRLAFEMRVAFFESTRGVQRIEPDGSVHVRQ